ncbi:MAG: carbohydrate binding domain-containing protein [Planctomycetota bacterium]|nr:carbohydrate binding domain-containing protein [Planctomycetota bacterium]
MRNPPPLLLTTILLTLTTLAFAQLPPPPATLAPFPLSHDPATPGAFSAADLLDKPAGRLGHVSVRNAHFYTGPNHLRFWGVNIAFSGCFPTHTQADAAALRLARFGFNAVRFHHMDMQPFPNGLFTDRTLDKLAPEALDRLDYFIAALKKQGLYSNLNLHVSRWYSRAHNWPNSNQLPEFDKMLDIFHPELIAAQKQFARDLLHHTNPYTNTRLADEPAVAIVEINNEDTLFLWGGEQKIANLPDPYATLFTQLWNTWLLKKYPTRNQLSTAWNADVKPLGPNFLRDPNLATLNKPNTNWILEQHESAKMSAALDASDPNLPLAKLTITSVTNAAWHLQFMQRDLALKKNQTYTLSFRAHADKPTKIDAAISQSNSPWANLGLSYTADLSTQPADLSISFTPAADEPNARIAFSLGRDLNTISIGNLQLRTGSPPALADDEDPAKSTVSRPFKGRPTSPQRNADWYDFLQQTDEAYFTEMRRFLNQDLAVKCPITGTIGLGPLGTLSQSKMDFVDAHSYWDHPQFPRGDWSNTNWLINNKPMVDNPPGSTLWALAATRVANKPFTVTEYNHSAPNEYQAECIPMIAAFAALQDWDGVFLFAYSHNNRFNKDRMDGYFDIEGNPLKMPQSPLAARLFLSGSVRPLLTPLTITSTRSEMLATGSRYYYNIWPFLQSKSVRWTDLLTNRLQLSFDPDNTPTTTPSTPDPRLAFSATTPATGQFTLNDPHALIFAGFTQPNTPITLGPLRITNPQTPFFTLILTPADPAKTLADSDRLLLALIARGDNTNMKWDENRRTLSTQWGTAPPRIEPVQATLSLASNKPLQIHALSPAGSPTAEIPSQFSNNRVTFTLGQPPTLWYELTREK